MTTVGSIGNRCKRSELSLNSPPHRSMGDDQNDELAQHFSESQANEPPQIRSELQAPSKNAPKDDLLASIENYVDDTTGKPQIPRTPSLLRNKQCYQNGCNPLLVSIGPYHHGKPELAAFEKLKIPVAQKFVSACCSGIRQLYEEVAKVCKSAREWYEKGWTDRFDDESFNKMMFLDACFVLYFIKYVSLENKGTDKEQEADPLNHWRCNLVFVQRDLFLLENQIPLLVLEVLMKFLFKGERLDLGTKLIQNFVEQKAIMPPQENSCTNAVKKFPAQMMGCSVHEKEKWKLDMDARPPHLLHLVREQLIGSSPEDKNKKSVKWYSHRSVTELNSEGIHFRPSQTNHVTDVKFKSHLISGTLTLPPIMVDYSTKDLLLNLVAYEMCPDGPSDPHIMSYVCLMDSLINHADDVKELRRRGILVNNLGSDLELVQLFNEMTEDFVFDPCAYADVKWQIQNYCKSKAQVWMAEWMHDRFNSPWAFLAFLGVIFVIASIVVQRYLTVFPR